MTALWHVIINNINQLLVYLLNNSVKLVILYYSNVINLFLRLFNKKSVIDICLRCKFITDILICKI